MTLKHQKFLLLFVFLLANKIHAQNLSVINSVAAKQTGFALVSSEGVADIVIDDDCPLVKLAANFFAEDVKVVSGRTPKVRSLSATGYCLWTDAAI